MTPLAVLHVWSNLRSENVYAFEVQSLSCPASFGIVAVKGWSASGNIHGSRMSADILLGVFFGGKKPLPEMKDKSTPSCLVCCSAVVANGSSHATTMSVLHLAQEANPERVLRPACTLQTLNFLGACPLPTYAFPCWFFLPYMLVDWVWLGWS